MGGGVRHVAYTQGHVFCPPSPVGRTAGQRTSEQQVALLAVAFEGEYWKPTCASCGVKMTERTSGKDGARFGGCVNYPRCKKRLSMTRVTANFV